MKKKQTDPIKALLQVPPSELRPGKIELPSPELYKAEEILLSGFLDPNATFNGTEGFQANNGLLNKWRALFIGWGWKQLTFPLALCTGLVLWLGFGGFFGKDDLLTRKGGLPKTQSSQDVFLHLGTWRKKNNSFKRVGHNDKVSQNEHLIFGFTLKKKGYVYLFVRGKKGYKEQLFPLKGQPAYLWEPGFFPLKDRGEHLYYSLGEQKGSLTFFVLKSTRVLPLPKLKELLQAKDFSKTLIRWVRSRSNEGVISFDRVGIKVGGDT